MQTNKQEEGGGIKMPNIMMNKQDIKQVKKFTDELTKLSADAQVRFSDWLDGFSCGLNLSKKSYMNKSDIDCPSVFIAQKHLEEVHENK